MKIEIINTFHEYCNRKNINFSINSSVKSYDDTTLFCPAGMQQYKEKFRNINVRNETIANIQSCIRLNDFDNIDDDSHLLYFNMIGLFSFRQMSIEDAYKFWIDFLKILKIDIDYITIHPDKKDWLNFIKEETKYDNECIWGDGDISGYCMEFYSQGLEIGNIVNPLGNCIDVGFGLERLQQVLGEKPKNKIDILKETALKIIESGFSPSSHKQGYVLRKILREINLNQDTLDHPFFKQEIERQKQLEKIFKKFYSSNQDKPKEWWWSTHGIKIEEFLKKS